VEVDPEHLEATGGGRVIDERQKGNLANALFGQGQGQGQGLDQNQGQGLNQSQGQGQGQGQSNPRTYPKPDNQNDHKDMLGGRSVLGIDKDLKGKLGLGLGLGIRIGIGIALAIGRGTDEDVKGESNFWVFVKKNDPN
jgi:hypothetical protein